jgi:hypothetical protein
MIDALLGYATPEALCWITGVGGVLAFVTWGGY